MLFTLLIHMSGLTVHESLVHVITAGKEVFIIFDQTIITSSAYE